MCAQGRITKHTPLDDAVNSCFANGSHREADVANLIEELGSSEVDIVDSTLHLYVHVLQETLRSMVLYRLAQQLACKSWTMQSLSSA